jgi:hypothetical protein
LGCLLVAGNIGILEASDASILAAVFGLIVEDNRRTKAVSATEKTSTITTWKITKNKRTLNIIISAAEGERNEKMFCTIDCLKWNN